MGIWTEKSCHTIASRERSCLPLVAVVNRDGTGGNSALGALARRGDVCVQLRCCLLGAGRPAADHLANHRLHRPETDAATRDEATRHKYVRVFCRLTTGSMRGRDGGTWKERMEVKFEAVV